MLFADASNEFTGQWLMVAIAVIGGIGILLAIAAYFATSRELETVTNNISDLNDSIKRLNEVNEQRAAEIHNRLNPLELKVGTLQGATDSFEKSFEKFTRIIEATSRANNDTITAFTRSLDTFANVVERSMRERSK